MMEKIYINQFDNIHIIQKYLEDNEIDEIYLKAIKINEKATNTNIFNENILSVYFENEVETREIIPAKYFKTLLKESGRIECSYLCFFKKRKSEKDINEEEIYKFLKNNKDQLRENLLNWDEDKVCFIELKKLSKQYKEKIIEELMKNQNISLIYLQNNAGQEKIIKLIENLKNNKEKILDYLEGSSPKLEKDIKDILDIKYLVSYNEKKMKTNLEEKEEPFKEALQIVICNELIKEKIDDAEIIKYFSKSYFKQAFYLYLKYILLLRQLVDEGEKVKIENSKSNQSNSLGIKTIITSYKNNLYIEKLKNSNIILKNMRE